MPDALRSMTFAEYRAIDAVNWSSLREMLGSPAPYRYRLDHPREDSTTLALGRAVHAAVFEPDRLPLEFAVWKGARRAGKAWDAFRAVHGDDTILKASEYERGLAMPARIVAVEVEPPHVVQVLALHDDDLYDGEQECARLLSQVAECTARRSWPAGPGDEQVLAFPAWARCRLEDDDLAGVDLVAGAAVGA